MPVISNNTISRVMASFGRKGGARRSDRKRLASAENARAGWQGEAGERRRAAIAARVAARKSAD